MIYFSLESMGRTSYLPKWEKDRPWLRPVKGSSDKAHCTICNKDFFVDKGGVSQVNTRLWNKSFKTQNVLKNPSYIFQIRSGVFH